MKVYFVRHGRTASNKLGRIMSRSQDESLDQEGLLEVKRVVTEKAPNMEYDIVFTSPLKRAAETAFEFADFKKVPLYHHEDMMELEFGQLSNKTWDEVHEITKGELNYPIWQSITSLDLSPYGGEDKISAQDRIKRFIEYLKTHHPHSKPLVVTHGGVLRNLNGLYPESASPTFKNASIHVLEV